MEPHTGSHDDGIGELHEQEDGAIRPGAGLGSAAATISTDGETLTTPPFCSPHEDTCGQPKCAATASALAARQRTRRPTGHASDLNSGACSKGREY